MKEYETVKFYGVSYDYLIIETEDGRKKTARYTRDYQEYNSDDELINAGSVDYYGRELDDVKACRVFAWDGVQRMKDGKKWFTEIYFYRVSMKEARKARELIKARFPQYKVFSFRYY